MRACVRVCDVCTMLFISYLNHRPSDIIIITYVCTYMYPRRPKVSDGRRIRNEVNVYIVYYYIDHYCEHLYTQIIYMTYRTHMYIGIIPIPI